VTDCRAVRDFDQPDHYLMMATRRGRVKKTDLAAYGRPLRSGLIAVRLREHDELVDVVVTKAGDEIVLATASGMAIRFKQSDIRPMGRVASGVKGIKLIGDDCVVGMVVADPEACLLTACANGYGKRTPFGPNSEDEPENGGDENGMDENIADENGADEEENGADENDLESEELSSQHYYRTQRRGGKGLRDIKTSARNGPAIGVVRVRDEDELMMITARGKIQRVPASDISIIGRNTQGVRIMNLDEGDTLVAVKRVPRQDNGQQPPAADD
jgi:DNA gyrase subunit A